jgi:hypothetical protein
LLVTFVCLFCQQLNNFKKKQHEDAQWKWISADSGGFIFSYPTRTPNKPVDWRWEGWDCIIIPPCAVFLCWFVSLLLSWDEILHSEMCQNHCLKSVLVLSSSSSILFLFRTILIMIGTQNKTARTCKVNCVHLDEPYVIVLHFVAVKHCHSFIYNELCFVSLKIYLLLISECKNNKRDCFLSTECIYVEWLVSTPQKFLHISIATYMKTTCFRTVYSDKQIHCT